MTSPYEMTAGACQVFFQVVKGFGFSRKEQQQKNLMARLFVAAVPIVNCFPNKLQICFPPKQPDNHKDRKP
jgi:hypothetical protein